MQMPRVSIPKPITPVNTTAVRHKRTRGEYDLPEEAPRLGPPPADEGIWAGFQMNARSAEKAKDGAAPKANTGAQSSASKTFVPSSTNGPVGADGFVGPVGPTQPTSRPAPNPPMTRPAMQVPRMNMPQDFPPAEPMPMGLPGMELGGLTLQDIQQGHVPSNTSPSVRRFGQPLRNDVSVARFAEHDHENDVNPEDFVSPDQPLESQGLGSESARENLSGLSEIEKRMMANVTRMGQPDMTGPSGRVEPSMGRKILGTAAGIGLGALTMNPVLGMNVRQSILDQPTIHAQQEAAMRRAPIEAESAGLSGIHGLATERMGREAALGQAAAAQQSAQTGAAQFDYNIKNPEYGEIGQKVNVNGADVIQQFPKRPNAAQPITRGAAPKTEQSGMFEKSVAPDGTVSIIDKSTSKAQVVIGTDGQPVKEGSQNAQQFDTYWDAYQKGDQNAMNAILRLVQAGAAQVGANIENEETRRVERQGEGRTVAANIAARVKAAGGGYAQARAMVGRLLTEQGDASQGRFTVLELAKEIEEALKAEFPDWNNAKPAGTLTLPKNAPPPTK